MRRQTALRFATTFTFQILLTRIFSRSITFAGVYDLLHFFNSGLINSYSAGGQVGYNYQKTARDTIVVVYRFDALRYSDNALSVNDNVIELGYRRLVAQRLSFNIAAGPDISEIHDPIAGNMPWTPRWNTR